MADDSPNAVVEAIDVDAKDAVQILLAGRFDVANVRNAGVIHEDVDSADLCDVIQLPVYARLIGYITCVMSRVSAGFGDFGAHRRRVVFVAVENANRSARDCELQRDSAPNAAARTRNDGGLAVKTELAATRAQSDTPRFQGMKSSWFFSSALVWRSPLAI